jgi:hypothetical protein
MEVQNLIKNHKHSTKKKKNAMAPIGEQHQIYLLNSIGLMALSGRIIEGGKF